MGKGVCLGSGGAAVSFMPAMGVRTCHRRGVKVAGGRGHLKLRAGIIPGLGLDAPPGASATTAWMRVSVSGKAKAVPAGRQNRYGDGCSGCP